MAGLFAALAALLPIAGSLWVAGVALLRHKRAVIELGSRYEIEERHKRRRSRDIESQLKYGDPSSSSFHAFIRRNDFERAGLVDNYDEVKSKTLSTMNEQPLSSAQFRDQWILLASAAAGVICLALSLIFSLYAASV